MKKLSIFILCVATILLVFQLATLPVQNYVSPVSGSLADIDRPTRRSASVDPTASPEPTIESRPVPTETPNPQPKSVISKGVGESGRSLTVLSVDIEELPGGAWSIIVFYRTGESTQQGYNDEWINLLKSMDKIVKKYDYNTENIMLVPETSSGERIGVFSVDYAYVKKFVDGKITRAQLLNAAKFTSTLPTKPTPAKRIIPTKTPVVIMPTDPPIQYISPDTPSGSCPSLHYTCSQFSSCDQAMACLAAGNSKLDRDKDGIPCESICK